MITSLLIVDDFLRHAEALRQRALALTYPDQQGAFPGRNSTERLGIEGLDQAVSRLVGEPLEPVSPLESHGKCRVTLAGDTGKAKVHVDHSHWSGILFLSKDGDGESGTDFFRHIRTDSERAPINQVELGALGYKDFDAMHADIVERDSNDDAAWERTMRVPMRFNRLILLRPFLWHTAGPGFGDTIENGRLVYLMFFNRKG